jgi:Holliday junction resolvase-like predicted endonuclease
VCVPAKPAGEVDLIANFDFKVMPTSAIKNSEGKWERVYTLVEVPEEAKFGRLARRWAFVRNKRNEALAALDWKVLRNLREQRLGLPTTDNIAELDAKMQALADITNTDDPFAIDVSQF